MWTGLLQDTRLRGVLLVFAPRPGVRWELCRCGRGSAFYVVWEACDLVIGATVNTYAEKMTSHPTPATPHTPHLARRHPTPPPRTSPLIGFVGSCVALGWGRGQSS